MPTDPAILSRLHTLWGEPVTEATSEADAAAAFVPSEWLPSTIPPTRPADDPASWDASTAELIGWFQTHRGRLPSEAFDLKPGGGVRVSDPAKFYRSLEADIATGPSGPRGRLGGLSDDLKSVFKVARIVGGTATSRRNYEHRWCNGSYGAPSADPSRIDG